MKLDCVKIVSEMKRQRLTSMDLANKAMCGLSTVQAAALGVPLEELMEGEV